MTTFALNLAKQIEAAKEQAELVAKKITIELFSRVIEKSPVDTGRFRAKLELLYSVRLIYRLLNQPTLAEAEPISKATSTVVSYTLNDQSVFLTNNLPYAERLENGWSKQAPNGMVRLSVMEIAK